MFPNHNSIISYMEAGGWEWENGLLLVSITANKCNIKNISQGSWLGHVRRSKGMIAGEVKPLG